MPFRISNLNSSVIRKMWEILSTDMMSSEESVSEEDALKVKKPFWRKSIVDDMFKKLNSVSQAIKSPQARRKMKRRVLL